MESTQTIARIAAESGYTIVSGYATGVDTFAHIGAMDAETPTMAVLGSGILRKEPLKPALERYILSSGIFVSELDDINAERAYKHLMARDRITSGLADIVIVVETDAAGGAVHTAGLAFKQGRQVYAVVWSGHEKYRGLAQCLGSDALVQAGIAQPLPVLDAGENFEQQVRAIFETRA
jgi:DNA processing protein